jgi:hypothetical protein
LSEIHTSYVEEITPAAQAVRDDDQGDITCNAKHTEIIDQGNNIADNTKIT